MDTDKTDGTLSSTQSGSSQRCIGHFARVDHKELILNVFERLGSKTYSVLKKLARQPELAKEEWEVEKVLDDGWTIEHGVYYLLKWKDWPACFASWVRSEDYKLSPRLLTEYNARVNSSSTTETTNGLGSFNAPSGPGLAKRITVQELQDMAGSLAKHLSLRGFVEMMQRIERDMKIEIFQKDEPILRPDFGIQHIRFKIPSLGEFAPNGIIRRKRLEWKLSKLEQVHIQIVNHEDDEAIPQLHPDFEYTVANTYNDPDISTFILASLPGCNCDPCGHGNPECCSQQAGVPFAYRNDVPNILIDPKRRQAIYECNPRCKCNAGSCSNRVLQNGLTIPMQLFKTKDRGWGLKTLKAIKRGQFVIEYVGEVITTSQANRREDNQYLFDLDFNPDTESLYTIDAMAFGNLSRFINSRCFDANLSSLAVYVECQHPDLPRIGFFAARDIEPFEELTYDYRMQGSSAVFDVCLCGSTKCRGTMKRFPAKVETGFPKKFARRDHRPRRSHRKSQPQDDAAERKKAKDSDQAGTSGISCRRPKEKASDCPIPECNDMIGLKESFWKGIWRPTRGSVVVSEAFTVSDLSSLMDATSEDISTDTSPSSSDVIVLVSDESE